MAGLPSLAPALKYLPRFVTGSTVHVQDSHALADKVLPQALLDDLRLSWKNRCGINPQIRFDEDGTSKTGRGPKSANTADPRYEERGFCRTSQSEYVFCTSADSTRPLAPSWKDYSRSALSLRPGAAH